MTLVSSGSEVVSFSHSKTRRFVRSFSYDCCCSSSNSTSGFDQSSTHSRCDHRLCQCLVTQLFPLNPTTSSTISLDLSYPLQSRHRKDCISFLGLVPPFWTSLHRERKIWFQVLGNLCLFGILPIFLCVG